MKIFKQQRHIEYSGYVRGYKVGYVYYDESGNVVDYDIIGDFKTIRDNTERGAFPDFDPNAPFTEEIEEDL